MNCKRSIGGYPRRQKIRKLESKTGDESISYTDRPVLNSHLNLLLSGKFSDVTFIVGECKERIPCHQLFLKARSPVFEVMFSKRWNQVTAGEVPLEDVNPETFKKFLLFIYADSFDANVSEALELLQLAHTYHIEQLVTKCEELLESELRLDNALHVFQAARMCESEKLIDVVGEMLVESLPDLQTHRSFIQLDKETLIYILKRDDLEMKEIDLFRLALQWAGNQLDATVEESLQDILPLIRFPTITLKDFTATVLPTNLLTPSKVIELYTYFGTADKAKRRLLRSTLGFSTQKRWPNDWDSTDSSSSSDSGSPKKSTRNQSLVCHVK